MGVVMGGALKCIVGEKSLCDHVLGSHNQANLPNLSTKFEGKVCSSSTVHICIHLGQNIN